MAEESSCTVRNQVLGTLGNATLLHLRISFPATGTKMQSYWQFKGRSFEHRVEDVQYLCNNRYIQAQEFSGGQTQLSTVN